MSCDITNTPLSIEPLPIYRRDPETASIRSSAPSYVSEAPAYSSRRPSLIPSSSGPRGSGLPAARYAPGFQSRAHGSVTDVESHNYNVGHWSSIRASHHSRQYQAVAARRASKAQSTSTDALLGSLGPSPRPGAVARAAPGSASSASSSAGSSAGDASFPQGVDEPQEPPNPLEDPYLVGEEAAAAARAQRIYREMCLRGDEAIRYEGKTWEFMLAQMADWEERERSWKKFRSEVGRTKILGRRIGLGGFRA